MIIWIWLAAALLFGLLLCFLIVKVVKADREVFAGTHPKRAKPLSTNQIQFQTRHFHFLSKDSVKLAAIIYEPKQNSRGTIFAFHYLGGSKTAIYSYIEPLLQAGFTVCSFDYPNHGDSADRNSSKYSLEDDTIRFIREVRARGLKGPYGTFGFSMGATLAFSAVDELPQMRAVVVDSGPLIDVDRYFRYVLDNKKVKDRFVREMFIFTYLHIIGFRRMGNQMRRRLGRLDNLPVLFIHSKKDKVIPFHNMELACQLLDSQYAETLVNEQAHHMTNRAIMHEAYDHKVVNFFLRWMKQEQ